MWNEKGILLLIFKTDLKHQLQKSHSSWLKSDKSLERLILLCIRTEQESKRRYLRKRSEQVQEFWLMSKRINQKMMNMDWNQLQRTRILVNDRLWKELFEWTFDKKHKNRTTQINYFTQWNLIKSNPLKKLFKHFLKKAFTRKWVQFQWS